MTLFLILGLFVLFYGFMLIIAPNVLLKIRRSTDEVHPRDQKIFSRRYLTGALLVLAGAYMIYFWYTAWWRIIQ